MEASSKPGAAEVNIKNLKYERQNLECKRQKPWMKISSMS